jgi:hypothetical protein
VDTAILILAFTRNISLNIPVYARLVVHGLMIGCRYSKSQIGNFISSPDNFITQNQSINTSIAIGINIGNYLRVV